jgi:hypothetical protein
MSPLKNKKVAKKWRTIRPEIGIDIQYATEVFARSPLFDHQILSLWLCGKKIQPLD